MLCTIIPLLETAVCIEYSVFLFKSIKTSKRSRYSPAGGTSRKKFHNQNTNAIKLNSISSLVMKKCKYQINNESFEQYWNNSNKIHVKF